MATHQTEWERIITAEIAEYSGPYTKLVNGLGYTGWLHYSQVDTVPGGYDWVVTSEYWKDGYLFSRARLGSPEGERWEEPDMAEACAAVAMESLLESRGGVVVTH